MLALGILGFLFLIFGWLDKTEKSKTGKNYNWGPRWPLSTPYFYAQPWDVGRVTKKPWKLGFGELGTGYAL